MAKRKVVSKVDFTWDGTDEIWSGTSALWTSETVYLVEYVLFGGSRGGVKKEWDTWNTWNKLDNRHKQKIVNLIVELKTGVTINKEFDMNRYEITAEDITLLREEYEKYIIQVEEAKVKVA